ncbi:hypothetical protein PP997_gp50 [Gordonia phage BigChungus]|uniref:Uncharacterized protein n=3 Tax=Ponsvirus TaxID=3044795 RepID=A0AAE7XD32_9CAUD|nr:hypothetical protein PP996_gp54 [Gordonia phage SheckWes]YP_010663398.1 hypothetical protein PP997_gp50 [Gordonia phage BigChungus]YP_010663470.1 hypothetical protein PP998_gp53 [Gordonia phage Vine]QNJ59410.1 hypothetical protein SEA_FEASTONYEET_50 [Gordonia phage Feastonyeet]UXE03291.1 membrane protein [Gordonia phage SummitAcademy]QDM56480.1 hypothetical protein SEA_SHECKWES_54 [Gordonia phage SheckWes]QNJ59550.1 hypothetical protein SEA_BIGCHUNGUS_50 [Gordonia phage BigChungus]QZD9776
MNKKLIASIIFAFAIVAAPAGVAAASPCTIDIPTGVAPCPPPVISHYGTDPGGDHHGTPDQLDPPAPNWQYDIPAPAADDEV